MRVGVNARFLHSDILEGMGRYTWENVKRIISSHPEDEFILFFDRDYSKKYVDFPNAKGVVVNPPARHPVLFVLWFELGLRKALGGHKVDVFLSTDNFLSLRSKVPTALVIHDLAYLSYPNHMSWVNRMYYKYFTPRFVKRANHIFTVSNEVKQDVLKHFDLESKDITVAYNACPERLNSGEFTFGELNDVEYFIYIGSLNNRKNIGNLLKAFYNVIEQEPNLKLVLVGRIYQLDDPIIMMMNDLIDMGSVVHLSNIRDAELNEILKRAVALTYVSWFEGFGIPLLEAMSQGVPVITSNISSMPEVAGDAALLVDPSSPLDIGDAMLKVYKDEKIRLDLIKRGYKRLTHFSWDRTANIIYEELLKLYKEKKSSN